MVDYISAKIKVVLRREKKNPKYKRRRNLRKNLLTANNEIRRGSPVDRRPSTAEAPPRGEIHPFSKMAVTFEPLIRF